jgi:hypothetical protein
MGTGSTRHQTTLSGAIRSSFHSLKKGISEPRLLAESGLRALIMLVPR